MHSILLRRISLILASWLMVTSVGASIDVHFCNGEIYSLGINAAADLCPGADLQDAPQEDARISNSSCCDQFSAHFQSDLDSGNDIIAIQYLIDSSVLPYQHLLRIPYSVEPIRLCYIFSPHEYEEDILTLFSVLRI